MVLDNFIAERMGNARGIIFDLDGTLIRGDTVLPGAVELASQLACPIIVASNNSSDTAESLSRKLKSLGFSLGADALILAGELALSEVARRFAGAEILLIASPTMRRRAQDLGLQLVLEGGDVVLVCRDEQFDYATLTTAAQSLKRGAVLLAANPDMSHPGPCGGPVPETGALVAAISAAADRHEAEFIGKPYPLMLNEALARLGVEPQDALLIGDNPATDGKGAHDLGIPFLQMGTVSSTRTATPLDILRAVKTIQNQPVLTLKNAMTDNSSRSDAPEGTDAAPTFRGVILRLQSLAPSLSPVARRLAEFIIESPNRVIEMSITELAETAGVSEGSVVSLCRQAGARGFQQLKIVLARELVTDLQFIHEDLDAEDDTARIIGKIFQSNVECIQATQQSLDLGAMERAAQAIKAAQRVEVYGIGSATPIALDAQYRLLRIGIQATAQVDSHVQAISASRTDKNVAVISISHSGSTTETLAATRLAHEAGATTIAITSAARSPITRYADIVLNTVARETRFRTEAMTSRIAQLAIVDGLISLVAMADQERATQTLRATFDVLSIKRL